MRFIQEWGGNIKRGKQVAFQKWLQANEPKLAKVHPKGSVYLGTFATIFSTEKHAGAVRTFVELDSYGAMDKAAAAAKDQSSEYGKLIQELTEFFDTSNDADWSNGLHKAVVDATVWDTK
ncbi:MAG: hypothetical protein Q7S35_12660 [Candidatus Limnocylindrales bacterium]|nr:hypothetical protein [Candidatus Limnocylindrales bacterium]